MELIEKTASTRAECLDLLSSLRSMQHYKKIKLVSGSFDENGYGVIEARFKQKGEIQVWHLNGVMDMNGGLTLRKIS